MAYDGLTVLATVKEFKERLTGGKISKIIQPEKDEIVLFIRNKGENLRVQISANPSLPLCCFTESSKAAPATAPAFCMLLRKQIGNGTILSVRQPDSSLLRDGLERVILFEIEHLDEMGDIGTHILSAELMGKYSNIILLRKNMTIIDAIKRISLSQSSVREVLPGREYFIPDNKNKADPLSLSEEEFLKCMQQAPEPAYAAIFHSITGISPVMAQEICFRASIDPDTPANCMDESAQRNLYGVLQHLLQDALGGNGLYPNILYKDDIPFEFSAVRLESYGGKDDLPDPEGGGALAGKQAPEGQSQDRVRTRHSDSMSEIIRLFYAEKDKDSRIRQRSSDLRKLLSTLLERASRKLSLQENQLRDTKGKDRFRVYGELLNTYGYGLKEGEDTLICENYYDGKEISIPLKKELSARENARLYFEKYDKLKRTELNLTEQLSQSRQELLHLSSILASLDMAETEVDLQEIRKEMSEFGFVKKGGRQKEKLRTQGKSSPLHFISSDGYEIFLGKNNYQNEYVTFRLAEGGDLWFHGKNIPGSHVIVKTGGKALSELPDRLFVEAASLAAWFSSRRTDSKVEVDYTFRKNLKKVPNGAPGFVIYHTNYSITVTPGIPLKQFAGNGKNG